MKNNKRIVRVGLIQMACGKDPAKNLQKVTLRIRQAAQKGARIISLQELFKTLYFCQTRQNRYFDLAETIPGPTTDVLSKLSRELSVVIVAPLFEKAPDGKYFNAAVVIDSGRILGKYRKMHIPDDPGFYEKFYFEPGDLGFKVFETRYARISVLICWDQWFPEAARLAALGGAEILFYPTAIGWKPKEKKETESYRNAWETIQRAHAIANGIYVAAVNRVGDERKLRFWGSSFVADPFGKWLCRGGAGEKILVHDCNLSLVGRTRTEWPFLRDRRVDAYQGITAK